MIDQFNVRDAFCYISADIYNERLRQDEKWGLQHNQICEWMTILGEEFGEACQEALRLRFDNDETRYPGHLATLREELVQVAAVAAAVIEAIDRERIVGP